MKKKNFYIVRYYRGSECIFATQLTKKQTEQYKAFIENIHENEAGGFTVWYRMNLDMPNWLRTKILIEMEYYKLNKENDEQLVECYLTLQDIKVLHNACLDITKNFPEMIGYEAIRGKLEFYIKDVEFEHQNPTPLT